MVVIQNKRLFFVLNREVIRTVHNHFLLGLAHIVLRPH